MDNDHISETSVEQQKRLLQQITDIALVGVSGSDVKASYFVLAYLQKTTYKLYPVNPRYDQIRGMQCYHSIKDLPITPSVAVSFFGGELLHALADSVIELKIPALWLQLGIYDETIAKKMRAHGIAVVQNACIKIEHSRWAGALRWSGVNTGVISSKRERLL